MSVFDRPSAPPVHPSTTSPRRDRPASLRVRNCHLLQTWCSTLQSVPSRTGAFGPAEAWASLGGLADASSAGKA